MPETMKFLGSIKNKVTKNQNGETDFFFDQNFI